MRQYLVLLVLLACPLSMYLMMRGSHGSEHHASNSEGRIADLEREVARLRRGSSEPESHTDPWDGGEETRGTQTPGTTSLKG